jgi:hypothetical protein
MSSLRTIADATITFDSQLGQLSVSVSIAPRAQEIRSTLAEALREDGRRVSGTLYSDGTTANFDFMDSFEQRRAELSALIGDGMISWGEVRMGSFPLDPTRAHVRCMVLGRSVLFALIYFTPAPAQDPVIPAYRSLKREDRHDDASGMSYVKFQQHWLTALN